jgi:hypothetical protein
MYAGLNILLLDILQITVVTARGRVVKASQFSHPTLFGALLGGGSAFGVVLEVVFQTHAAPTGFVGIFGKITSATEQSHGSAAWESAVRGWTELQWKLSLLAPFSGYSSIIVSERCPSSPMISQQEWCADSETSALFCLHLAERQSISSATRLRPSNLRFA